MRKFAPRGVRICPGCPPKKTETITVPKFKMTLPSSDSKITTIKHNEPKKDKNISKRGESTTLF